MSDDASEGPFATAAGDVFALRPTGPPLVRGVVLGARWELQAELGRGATGVVFRAFDRATKEAVALKVFSGTSAELDWLERFGREVKLARQLQHPNVCRVFDLVEVDGHRLLTMELAEHGSLRGTIESDAHRPVEARLADARAIAAGIAAMHAVGIVHRDIKPENILRRASGELVVSDFGLAFEADRKSRVTRHVGTPLYMAPEVALGEPATKRSDVFALGLVLHEVVFGKRPELSEHAVRAGSTWSGGSEDEPPTVRALRILCFQCLAPRAADRPEDAGIVARRLAQIAERSPLALRLGAVRWRRVGIPVVAATLVTAAGVMASRGVGRPAPGSPGSDRDLMVFDGTPADWLVGARQIATLASPVHCVTLLPNGSIGIIAGEPRTATVVDPGTGATSAWDLPAAAYEAKLERIPDPMHNHCPDVDTHGRVLFTRIDGSGGESVALLEPGKTPIRLTPGDLPRWSKAADAFAVRTDNTHVGIYDVQMRALTMLPEVIADGIALASDFEPGGERLVVRFYDSHRGYGLARFDIKKRALLERVYVVDINKDSFVRIRLGPVADGQTLAYVVAPNGLQQVVRYDFSRGIARWLGEAPAHDLSFLVDLPAAAGAALATAAPRTVIQLLDDQGAVTRSRLLPTRVYSATVDGGGNIAAQVEVGRYRQVQLLPADGGPARRLGPGRGDGNPAFVDGDRAVLMTAVVDENRDALLVCPIDGSACRTLHTPGDADYPALAPGGRHLAYVAWTPTLGVRVYDLETRELVSVPDTTMSDGTPCGPRFDGPDRLWVVREREGARHWVELALSSLDPTGRTAAIDGACAARAPLPSPALANRTRVVPRDEAALWIHDRLDLR